MTFHIDSCGIDTCGDGLPCKCPCHDTEYLEQLEKERDQWKHLFKDADEVMFTVRKTLKVPEGESMKEWATKVMAERDEYSFLLFQPCGESHHDANKCPYCVENLNGKT